jgi:hypothetical protein
MATYQTKSARGLSFVQQIEANNVKAMEAVNKKCYDVAKELFTMIVDKTPSPIHPGPWAKGQLVNNWFPIDGADYSTETTEVLSDFGADSLARISQIGRGEQFLFKDGTVTISNNLPYAVRAEEIGWPPPEWSGKSGSDGHGGPYRMVSLSIQYISNKYSK